MGFLRIQHRGRGCSFTDGASRGFSLIELVIVIAILAILASIVAPRFINAQAQAEAVSAGQSMKAIAKAAMHYYAKTGEWPADKNRRIVPDELLDYISEREFEQAPLGGAFDFEDWRGKNWTAGGDPIGICVSIVEGDPNLYEAVDREIDDGDLTTGAVRFCESKPRLVYVLQFQ